MNELMLGYAMATSATTVQTAPANETPVIVQTRPDAPSSLPITEGVVIAAAIAVLLKNLGPMFVTNWLTNQNKKLDAEVETDKTMLNALITTLAQQQAASQEHVNNMLAQSSQSYQLIATMLKQNSDAIVDVSNNLQSISAAHTEQFNRINAEIAKLIELNKMSHTPVKDLGKWVDK